MSEDIRCDLAENVAVSKVPEDSCCGIRTSVKEGKTEEDIMHKASGRQFLTALQLSSNGDPVQVITRANREHERTAVPLVRRYARFPEHDKLLPSGGLLICNAIDRIRPQKRRRKGTIHPH